MPMGWEGAPGHGLFIGTRISSIGRVEDHDVVGGGVLLGNEHDLSGGVMMTSAPGSVLQRKLEQMSFLSELLALISGHQ